LRLFSTWHLYKTFDLAKFTAVYQT
jgi:hypothetical protein